MGKMRQQRKCPPHYEFQRIDTTGNVYLYFNGEDKLLYNFNISVGDQYPSAYSGFNWQLVDKYTVTGFGKNLIALDYVLKSLTGIVKKRITIIEEFGLTRYLGDLYIDRYYPDGEFFGGVINQITYGYPLVKRQQIDWSEYYPLQVGDFWIYRGNTSNFYSLEIRTILKDTLINNKIYKKIKIVSDIYGTRNTGYKYERFENRSVYEYNFIYSDEVLLHKFSACVGDTISGWRLNNKNYETLHFFMYPDIVFYSKDFSRGIGYTGGTIEFGGTNLVGAVINGVVYGDTTLTGIEEEKAGLISDYKLFQNYPNPFNPTTTIKYQIVKPNFVTIKIYDVLGSEVEILVNQYQNSGRYNVTFDANDLSSGIYIYVLKAGSYLTSKKLILLK